VKTTAKRLFRLGDGMVLVAATAVAFTIFRQDMSPGVAFNTFGGIGEQWLFFWMNQIVPFPAVWSLALFALSVFDRSGRRRRKPLYAGSVGKPVDDGVVTPRSSAQDVQRFPPIRPLDTPHA
jgi:hypothetical protein